LADDFYRWAIARNVDPWIAARIVARLGTAVTDDALGGVDR
jgi:hypothetical protein